MVFPIEDEPRIKRRALNLCQEHLRKIVEVVRKTVQMIDAFITNDINSISHLYDEVQRLSEDVANSKRIISQEIIEAGAILINREDFLRFTFITSEIPELCKGVSFRILAIVEHKWDLPQDIKRGISELSSAMFNAMMRLRDTVFALNYGSPQILERAREVEVAEKEVDNIYRRLEISLLEHEMDIPKMLIARDLIKLLEDTTDKIEDASDAARILALAL